jgi:amino-acid N-acetyltransferase
VATEILRRADAHDADALVALVGDAGLPLDGVADGIAEFFVAERDSRLVGCCGLEDHGDDALLRSVAVVDEVRGRGVGARLVALALSTANERGLRSVTLLTTTAADYFTRFGFRAVDRDEVPERVRASDEFRSVCPSTAVAMLCRFDGENVAKPTSG